MSSVSWGSGGTQGTQVKTSDGLGMFCTGLIPRAQKLDLVMPFVGEVAHRPIGACYPGPFERRRKPAEQHRSVGSGYLGKPSYGSGTPKLSGTVADRYGIQSSVGTVYPGTADTCHGPILVSYDAPKQEFMPTADTIDFLKYQYLGSRLLSPPERYYFW